MSPIGLIVALAGFCYRRPWLSLVVALGAAAVSLGLAFSRLYFEADWISLFPRDDPYRQKIEALHREFPHPNDIMVLVRGGQPREREAYLETLAGRLKAEPDFFQEVFVSVDLQPFRKHALWYLDRPDLESVQTSLQAFGPLLKKENGLEGVLRAIPQGLEQASRARVKIVLELATGTLEQLLACFEDRAQFHYQSPFQSLLPPPPDPRYEQLLKSDDRFMYNTLANGAVHYLLVLPPVSKATYGPAAPTVDRLREILSDLEPDHRGLRVSITGAPVLATDERRTCNEDALHGALISLGLVLCLFVFGFRELGRPVLVLISLGVGMAWTAGYTTLTVGHLNFLTITFLSMLTGLGADFGIHILARYAEERENEVPPLEAVEKTMRATGSVTWIGAIVTSAGFWTLRLSDFQAVAELGVIAGGGVLLCFLALSTVLWSWLALLEHRCQGHRFRPPGAIALILLEARVLCNPVLCVSLFGLLTLGAALYGRGVGFDYNLLHMQDPKLDSLRNEVQLAENGNSVVMCAVSVVNDLEEGRIRSKKLAALPTVARVDSILPLVPPNQARRRPLVQQLVLQAQALPRLEFEPIQGAEGLTDLQETLDEVDQSLERVLPPLQADPALGSLAAHFHQVWRSLAHKADAIGPGAVEESLDIFQKAIEKDLDRLLGLLREQTDEPPTMEMIPRPLRVRAVGVNGKIMLRVVPRHNTWNRPALEDFVADLKTIDPQITGDPVLMWHFNYLISATYHHVGWYTYAAVFTLLLVYFRRPLAAVLTLLPISLSLVWMLALMRWCDISFNPANFIALPMLVGIGASFGMQVVARAWEEGAETMLSFSTGPAVIFSALMAMSGFGSLLWSNHVGVRSLGFIVTAAVAANLLASLLFLPALLRLLRGQRALRATSSASTGE